MPILANFHTHCTMCDGKSTAEEMILAAIGKGFHTLGMSCHGDTFFDPEYRLDLPGYFAEMKRLREVYGSRLEILAGLEQDNLARMDGTEEAEYLIGSTHYLKAGEEYLSVDNTEEEMRRLAEEYFGGDYYRLSRAYYDLVSQVVDRTDCAIIGHYDLVVRFNDSMRFLDEEVPLYWKPALEVMEALVKRGRPFEINTGAYARGRKKDLYPNPFLLRKLREFGGEIVISSDAHEAGLLDGGFDEAVWQAVRAGFTHTNLLVRGTGGTGAPEWRQAPLDTF